MTMFEGVWLLFWHKVFTQRIGYEYGYGECMKVHDCAGAGCTSNLMTSTFIRSFGVPDERGARFTSPYVPLLRNEGFIVHVE